MAINFDHQRDRISTNSRVLTVNTNGALTIPVGTNGQRPTSGPSGGLATGQIRFNSQLSAFEGYNGIAWSSLGGVIDVDQDTKITVESSPGADEDTLTFFTAGQIRATIDENGDTVFAGNVQIDGTLTVDGGITLGDNIALDILTLNAKITGSLLPSANDTYSLGGTSEAWKDLFLSESVTFEGGTSENEIVIPTNQSDALSITESNGDLIVFTTTTGTRLITIYPNTVIEGTLTVGTSAGTTTIGEILDEDDFISNSDTALATQQSIKAYVDNSVNNSVNNVDLNFAGTAGTGTVNLLTQTFTITGTANEIETTALDQTLTIGLPDDVTITNNLNVGGNTVITGNLTVNGSTTTVSTTELVVEDNIITLNQGEVGAGVTAGSAGIEIDRGTESTVSFVWNEANDRWTTGSQDIEASEFFGTIDGGTF